MGNRRCWYRCGSSLSCARIEEVCKAYWAGMHSRETIVTSSYFVSNRMWLKCKAMQDVEVKLPPGLAPNMVRYSSYKNSFLVRNLTFTFILYVAVTETSPKSG